MDVASGRATEPKQAGRDVPSERAAAAGQAGRGVALSFAGALRRRSGAKFSAARNDPRLHGTAELGDLARPSPPDAVPIFVLDTVFERDAQRSQSERLAEHVGVDRDVAHERMFHALLEHLVELV